MSDIPQNTCLFKRIEELEMDAQNFGFYWEHINQLVEQIQSECIEVQEAWQKNNRQHLQEEIGDLLQAAVSLAVFCKLDPHATLLKSIEKFQKRYAALVALAKEDGHANLQQQSMEVLSHYWEKAKNERSNSA
ncbi:MazG nucleotide pyrophosphohydrolase domain-containing protein [Parachlamydia acanthamoebae]|nr:MazG nucleotide pyrophosphohydrolase domain-containing protein [Parachlamydia acanthamoebae]